MRKLTDIDKGTLLNYLNIEPEYNIYILGDIDKYGFDSEVVDVFVNEQEGQIDCVLMRYCTSYVIYSCQENYNASIVYEYLKDKEVHCISGKSEVVHRLCKLLGDKQFQELTLMSLTKQSMKRCGREIKNVIRLCAKDLERIRYIYVNTEEFREKYITPKGKEKLEIEFESGRYYGKLEAGELVATAMLAVEHAPIAMLDNVAVLLAKQGRGYGYDVVYSLCKDFLDEGKEGIYVFFSNPHAESIYRKIGFEYIGKYALLK